MLAGVVAAVSGVSMATAASAVPLGGEETATSLSPMAAYDQWNVVSFGDMALHVESDGAVAVGGELTFTQTNVGMKSSAVVPGVSGTVGVLAQDLKFAAPSSGTLQVHAGGLQVGNGGDVDLLDRDSNGANVAMRAVAKGLGYDSTPSVLLRHGQTASVNAQLFSELFSQAAATETSRVVSASTSCNPQAAVEISGTAATVRPVQGTTSTWTLTATQLNALTEIKFEGATITGGSGTNIVINVTGDEPVTLRFNMPGVGEANAGGILWNFAESTQITQSGDSTYGSILAPQALFVKSSANSNGTLVVAGGVLSGSEQHDHPFTGTMLSCDTVVPPEPSPTPEGSEEPSESPSPEVSVEPSDTPSPEVSDEPSQAPTPEVSEETYDSPVPAESETPTVPVGPASDTGDPTQESGATETDTPSAAPSAGTPDPTVTPSSTATSDITEEAATTPSSTTNGELAHTGSDAAGILAAVLALSVGGAAVLALRRGRRK
jgi:Predicted solute binding protein